MYLVICVPGGLCTSLGHPSPTVYNCADTDQQELFNHVMNREDLKILNDKAKIPMTNAIQSLNVSVACGVSFFEIKRQRLI